MNRQKQDAEHTKSVKLEDINVEEVTHVLKKIVNGNHLEMIRF